VCGHHQTNRGLAWKRAVKEEKEAGGTFVLPSITTMGTSIVGHR